MASCKFCGNGSLAKKGFVLGKQFYECRDCGRRFVENGAYVKMRTKAEVISAALSMYFDGLSVRKVEGQIASLFGVKVSHVAIWKWVLKFSELVDAYTSTLTPDLSGEYHHDETAIKIKGKEAWFWEMVDERTRFLVAAHLSDTRTFEDTVKQFRRSVEVGKRRPKTIYVDGSFVYQSAFNRVFYSRYKEDQVRFVQRVGINARKTNNIVERLHGSLKDRLKPMRGLKNKECSRKILEGYVVHYNYCKPHSALGGRTPATAAGIESLGRWNDLIVQSIRHKAKGETNGSQKAPVVIAG